MVGMEPYEMVGKKCFDLFKTHHCGTDMCACERALKSGHEEYAETICHPGTQDIDIGYSGVPYRVSENRIIGTLMVATDMTDIKSAQRVADKRSTYQDSEVKKLVSNLERLARGELACDMAPAPADEDTAELQALYQNISDSLHTSVNAIRAYIGEISAVLGDMSGGNLDTGINGDFKGDFMALKESINNIAQSLNMTLSEVNASSDQVATGTRHVSEGSQALSQGATEQASAVEQLTASISQIAEQTRGNAASAGNASRLSMQAREHAEIGNRQMKEMLKSMQDIDEASASISKIIKVIDDIAFQTNLLALNAAVEAARAGQHGKGFAVVAEEVRSLAGRSANAAKETTELIEGTVKKVEHGTRIATETAKALDGIVTSIEMTSQIVDGIAAASNEQATAATQITKGIEQVSQVVQNTSATAEESAAASEELSGQAAYLKEMVGHFRLRSDQKRASLQNPAQSAPQIAAPKAKPTISMGSGSGGFGKY